MAYAGMENFGILHLIIFVMVFGGLILAMVAVGTAAMVWLWVQIFKWARHSEKSRSENASDASNPPVA